MSRYPSFFLALVFGFVSVGGCSSRTGEESSREAVGSAQLQLAATGISANITTTPWGDGIGFNSQVVVVNTGTQPTATWEVDVQFTNGSITAGPWEATAVQSGSMVTLRPTATNAVIQPGNGVMVTFNGAWNATPHSNPTVIAVRRDVAPTGSGGATSGGASAVGGKGGAGGSSGSNLALDRPATASSSLGANPAPHGNDSSAATSWCASTAGLNEWWSVDLGASYALTSTEVTWPYSGRVYQYTIAASPDGVNYTEVVNQRSNTRTAQTQSDNFSATARYLRLQVTGLPTSPLTSACISDFKAFGVSAPNSGGGGTSGTGTSTSTGGTSSSGSVTGTGSGSATGTGSGNATGGAISSFGGSSSAGGAFNGGTGASMSGGGSFGGTSSGFSSATTPVTFSFQLPRGVDRSRIAFGVTGGELRINDHSKVQAPAGIGGFASISAVANGRVFRLGYFGEVQDLYSERDVTLANRGLVHGDLHTRGDLTAQEGSQVFGKTVFNAPMTPTEVISWTVPFPDTSGEPSILQPDSGTVAPAPGAYTGFVVNRSAHLRLVAGVYYFNTLRVLDQGYLDIDNSSGAVIIYVRSELGLAGNYSRTVAGRGLLIGYAGSLTVNIERPFQGILVAPSAPLVFAAGQSSFAGSFYAPSITVHQFNYVDHEPWTHDSLCAAADACSPICPCSFTDLAPCSSDTGCQSGLQCTSLGHCACVPQCEGKRCGDDLADGCGGTCPMVCNDGELGCARSTDCKEGSSCLAKGELRGFPAGTNICLPSICNEMDPRKPNCGVGGTDCGSCPACTPNCTARNCGPDGCGGSCGPSSEDLICLGGQLVGVHQPWFEHSERFPDAIRTNFIGTGAEAGAIPSTFKVTDRGTASYTIPLQLPPGRHGLIPNLSLTYESTRSSGMVGLGWGIGGFSKIERCNRIPAIFGEADPISLTADDAFCLDGVVLVPSPVGGGSLKPAHTHDTELNQRARMSID